MMAPTIVIIGAGVIGLSAAVKLQELFSQSHKFILVAEEFPSKHGPHSANYASMWAGAHVRPIPGSTPQLRQEATWLKRTMAQFSELIQREPQIGLSKVEGIELLDNPSDAYLQQTPQSFARDTGLAGFKRLDQVPEGVVLGYRYETYCVNPPKYCRNLLRRFERQGGKVIPKRLTSEWEAFTLSDDIALVVNASGIGFGDAKSFPTRGQTVRTDLETRACTVTRQHKDGSWSFIIPRSFSGGTIIGGTKEPHDWSTEPDMSTRETLLTKGKQLIPFACSSSQARDIQVLNDVVGRRPTREGGTRIELEEKGVVTRTGAQVNKKVIHAYGAGGRGYELSWGLVEEVSRLAKDTLLSPKWPTSKL